jgi:hypothetical protein
LRLHFVDAPDESNASNEATHSRKSDQQKHADNATGNSEARFSIVIGHLARQKKVLAQLLHVAKARKLAWCRHVNKDVGTLDFGLVVLEDALSATEDQPGRWRFGLARCWCVGVRVQSRAGGRAIDGTANVRVVSAEQHVIQRDIRARRVDDTYGTAVRLVIGIIREINAGDVDLRLVIGSVARDFDRNSTNVAARTRAHTHTHTHTHMSERERERERESNEIKRIRQ